MDGASDAEVGLSAEEVRRRFTWARRQGRPAWLWPDVPIETWRAALYRALALCAAAGLAALSLLSRDDAASHVAVALLALPRGFFALRAFGETLARYDPVTEF